MQYTVDALPVMVLTFMGYQPSSRTQDFFLPGPVAIIDLTYCCFM